MRISKFIKLLFALLIVMLLIACDNEKLAFEQKEVSISVGTEEVLALKAAKESYDLEYSSSNKKIVAVNQNGKIIGLDVGAATVTVKVKNKDISASINVVVTAFTGTIAFDKTSITVVLGDSKKLIPLITPSLAFPLKWTSDNESVAEVDQDGNVTAKAVGATEITVSGGGKSATINVKVVIVSPTNITIVGAGTNHKALTSVQLTVIVTPSYASPEIDWSSNDEAIATVTEEGLVEFVGLGNVIITATAKAETSVAAHITIQVTAPDPASVVITTESDEHIVCIYDELQLEAVILPGLAAQDVTWEVSDPTIAVITNDGLLYGINEGVVTVIATSAMDDSVFKTLEITVYRPEPTEISLKGRYQTIKVGEEMQLATIVTPDIASQNVIYSSSDEAIATVSETGMVKGIAAGGEAVITATSVDYPEISATFVVKVAPNHFQIIFNPDFSKYERYEMFTDENFKDDNGNPYELYYAINAFTEIDSDVQIRDKSKVYFYPGTYHGDFFMDKGTVTITSANAEKRPTENIEPFLPGSATATIITGRWMINANKTKIRGFSFTGDARIEGFERHSQYNLDNPNTLQWSGFEFENNYVYDTTRIPLPWKEEEFAGSEISTDAVPGFISFYSPIMYCKEFTFKNNKFSNVKDTNIFMYKINGINIEGNIFSGGDRDAIRLADCMYSYGNSTIKDNTFEDFKYNGIYFRWAGADKNQGAVYLNVYNNTFKNIGEAGKTITPECSKIGAIANPYTGEWASMYFTIKYNIFDDCVNYLSFRDNITDYISWKNKGYERKVQVEYNAFIDSEPVGHYFHNLLITTDTPTSNVGHNVINHNFYGISATEKTTINNTNNTSSSGDGQFGYRRPDIFVGGNNETIYNTLSDLQDAIKAIK